MATLSADAAALEALAVATAVDRVDAAALDVLAVATAVDRVDAAALDVLVMAAVDFRSGAVALDVLVLADVSAPPPPDPRMSYGTLDVDMSLPRANAQPYEGVVGHDLSYTQEWGTGTDPGQFDRMVIATFVIPPLGVEVVDLTTVLQQDGTQLGLVGVRSMTVRTAPDSPPGGFSVAPDAVDGWVGLLQAGSATKVLPGAVWQAIAPGDTGYPVTSGSKRLAVSNLDAVDAATITLIFSGVSA